jgi:hypothetical protein
MTGIQIEFDVPARMRDGTVLRADVGLGLLGTMPESPALPAWLTEEGNLGRPPKTVRWAPENHPRIQKPASA